MSARIASLLSDTQALGARVDAAMAKLAAIRADAARLRPTFDFKLLLDCEQQGRTLRDSLDQARAQLEAGNGFLMGFSLWMTSRNVARFERLVETAAKDAQR